MSATWVRGVAAGYFGDSYWVSDCGLYVGPWPPVFPATLPEGCDQMEWYIGTPNPNGQPNEFQDGSYPDSTVSDLWNYGSGPRSSLDEPLAPGSHLMLLWGPTDYQTMPVPPVEPESLIPAGYVTGGAPPPPVTPIPGAWSAWQSLPPTVRNGQKRTLMQDLYWRNTPADEWVNANSLVHGASTQDYPLRANQYSFPTIASPGREQTERTMQQYAANPIWETDRRWDLLDYATQGVDYARIPGKALGDLDEFIDYESPTNQHVSWAPLTAQMEATAQAEEGMVQEKWWIGFGLGQSYALPDPPPDPPQPHPFSIGGVFFQVVGARAAGPILNMPDDPSPETAFWFAIELTNEQIEHTDGYGPAHDGYASFQRDVVIQMPVQTYQMPRWRCWVPTIVTNNWVVGSVGW